MAGWLGLDTLVQHLSDHPTQQEWIRIYILWGDWGGDTPHEVRTDWAALPCPTHPWDPDLFAKKTSAVG